MPLSPPQHQIEVIDEEPPGLSTREIAMELNHHTAAGNVTASADLQDIAALDRLAGGLAPQATLRRYARQHRIDGSAPRHTWRRLLAAARRH